MLKIQHVAGMAGLCLLALPHSGAAHAVAGARVFEPTLTMDDPGVSDEASLPTFSYQHGEGGTDDYEFNLEYDKTITPNTALILNDGWNIARAPSAKTQSGFQNLFLTLKYQVYVNAEHEFITSIGVVREFGGTGRVSAGADRYGSTAPTIYVGKGFGDLPIGPLRALGVTGELSYSVADIGLKGTTTTDPDTGAMSTSFNQGSGNALFGAVSLQYSLEYLRGQVKDYGFPDFINRLVPLVELTWTSSTNPPGAGPTQFVIAPGVIYAADTWDVGVEALVPGNKASGPNAGVIAQIHLYLDDLFPNTIGKPIFE